MRSRGWTQKPAREALAERVFCLHLAVLKDAIADQEQQLTENERTMTPEEWFEADDSVGWSAGREQAARKERAAGAKRQLELLSEEEDPDASCCATRQSKPGRKAERVSSGAEPLTEKAGLPALT